MISREKLQRLMLQKTKELTELKGAIRTILRIVKGGKEE